MEQASILQKANSLQSPALEQYLESILVEYPSYDQIRLRLVNLHSSSSKWKEAIRIAEVGLQLNSKFRMMRLKLINAAIQIKSIEQAQIHIGELLKINPKDIQAYVKQGQVLLLKDQKEEAISVFKKALSFNPAAVGAVNNLVRLYVANSNTEEAAEILDSALKISSDEFHFLVAKGKLELHKKDVDGAILFFKRALNNANNYNQECVALVQISMAEEHILDVESLIQNINELAEKKVPNIWLGLRYIHLLVKAGHLEEAEGYGLNMLKQFPNEINLKLWLARVKIKLYQFEEAKVFIEESLSLQPNQIAALLLKAEILIQQESLSEVLKVYRLLLESEPKHVRGYVQFAQFLFSQGEIEEAQIILNKGIKQCIDPKLAYLKLIHIHKQIGNFENALELIERGLEKFPQGKIAFWHYQAQIQAELGDFEESLLTAKKILDVDKNNKEANTKALRQMAMLNLFQYQNDEAKKNCIAIIEQTENHLFERNRLAILYALEGNFDEAINQLKLATQEIESKNKVGKIQIPLNGHFAKVINDIRINPRLAKQLQESLRFQPQKRIFTMCDLLKSNPKYFGAALFLANELRDQGLLNDLNINVKQHKSNRVIPKRIVQYWDSDDVPENILNITKSWKEKNPTYKYQLFSRNSAYSFLKRNYNQEVVDAFINCEHPAMQADFFRLAFLNKKGGFYADVDDKCRRSLDSLTELGADLILKLGDFGCFSNNFLACSANNEIIEYAFQNGVENLHSYYNEGPWFKLGPGHITSSVTYFLAKVIDKVEMQNWPRVHTLSQSIFRKYVSQHLHLPYKLSDKSWFNAEYSSKVTIRKIA